MIKQLCKAIPVVAFALITSGFTQQAHADKFKVRLDNKLTSNYDDAKSAAEVIVRAYFPNGSFQQAPTQYLSTIRDAWEFPFDVAGESEASLWYITVSVSGTPIKAAYDLLILDKVQLLNAAGTVSKTYGIDNDFGYCVSWEDTDGGNVHCHDGTVDHQRIFYRR
jgi:hypothetical protein